MTDSWEEMRNARRKEQEAQKGSGSESAPRDDVTYRQLAWLAVVYVIQAVLRWAGSLAPRASRSEHSRRYVAMSLLLPKYRRMERQERKKVLTELDDRGLKSEAYRSIPLVLAGRRIDWLLLLISIMSVLVIIRLLQPL